MSSSVMTGKMPALGAQCIARLNMPQSGLSSALLGYNNILAALKVLHANICPRHRGNRRPC